MKYQSRHRNKFAILVIVLVFITAFTLYEAYHYYYKPPIVVVQHFLSVDVVTDKNYASLDEVMGKGAYQSVVILPEGGINFYKPSPGWNVSREVNLSNAFDYPIWLETNLIGNISQFLTIYLPKKSLEPKEFEIMNLTVKIPNENVAAGHYSGNLTISFIPKKT